MHDDDDRSDRQQPVEKGYAERPQEAGPRGLVVAFLHQREDEEDQRQHHRQVDAPVQHFLQQAETGGVVVKQ